MMASGHHGTTEVRVVPVVRPGGRARSFRPCSAVRGVVTALRLDGDHLAA